MRKKLLFISSRPIYPITGGDQIRTSQCLDFLCLYFDVHEVVIGSEKNLPQSDKYTSCQYFKVGKLAHIWQALHFLVNTLPIQVNYYYTPQIQRYIDSVIANYDIVFCNNLRTAQYVRKYTSKIRIIDYVDAISMNYDKARHYAKFPMNLIYTIDYQRCKRYESVLLEEFDKACVISEVDKEYILRNSLRKKGLKVIGNMAHISDAKLQEEENVIVFIGKMDYAPNVLAVKNFVKNIFPCVLQTFPSAVFYIVGAHPAQAVQSLANGKNIIVTGFVDDINVYLDKAAIVVAPMISGAGIQNKIIQAMGRGRCVVTTSIGAEGLTIRKNEIGIADTNSELSTMIINLLKDLEKRKVMGMMAKKYVREHLSYETVSKNFEELLYGLY